MTAKKAHGGRGPAPDVIDVGNGLWNIRGSFELAGFVDLGTQASLVRRSSGKYVLLDGCELSGATRRWVLDVTNGGKDLEAVLHVHPFHTLHVRRTHELFPGARLYGTERHHRKFAELPWEPERTDEPALHALFAEDLDFSVPAGVDFIPSNESLHFASVLVFHPASRTLHVDDTLLYVPMPRPLRSIKPGVVRFHPTLGRVLERRAGAARDFRGWARELVARCRDVDNLCAAHTGALIGGGDGGPPVAARVEGALRKVERTLGRHERKHG